MGSFMDDDKFGLRDYTDNKYAACARELGDGLGGWSSLFLIPFSIYRIYACPTASLLTLKGFIVVIAAGVAFAILAKIINAILALFLALILSPLLGHAKLRTVQNIQTTFIAGFGFALCVATWFFAKLAVKVAY